MGLILKCREMREKIRHCGGMGVSFVLKVAREPTHLEVLNEVVEHAEPFRVFAVLDVDQRADFCGLE